MHYFSVKSNEMSLFADPRVCCCVVSHMYKILSRVVLLCKSTPMLIVLVLVLYTLMDASIIVYIG